MSNQVQERNILREPFFMIVINGETLDPDRHDEIVSVSVEDEDEKLDIGRIVIYDVTRYFVNHPNIRKDATISIYMGHRQNYRRMLYGKITQVETNFREDGVCEINISAIDMAVVLGNEPISEAMVWTNTTLSQVIHDIVTQELFCACEVEDTVEILPQISQQKGETSLAFIRRKTNDMGFYFYRKPDETGYYWGSRKMDQQPKAVLEYYQGECSIINFNLQYVNKEDVQGSTTSVKDIDVNGETEERVSVNKGKNSVQKLADDEDYVSVDKSCGTVEVQERG